MNFCSGCGNQFVADESFCTSCGAPRTAATPSASPGAMGYPPAPGYAAVQQPYPGAPAQPGYPGYRMRSAGRAPGSTPWALAIITLICLAGQFYFLRYVGDNWSYGGGAARALLIGFWVTTGLAVVCALVALILHRRASVWWVLALVMTLVAFGVGVGESMVSFGRFEWQEFLAALVNFAQVVAAGGCGMLLVLTRRRGGVS